MNFYWYYSIHWLDMLMHFLGGLWVSLFVVYFLFLKKDFSLKVVLLVLGLTLLVGVLWELFEVSVNSFTLKETFDTADTLSDLLFDMLGSIASLFYIKRFALRDSV